jgi:hypothetical protein
MDRARVARRRVALVWGIVVSLALLIVLSSVSASTIGGSAMDRRDSTSLMAFSAATQYFVTFVETGLPTGTNWTVILNGTPQYTFGSSMNFSEADGEYLFTVGGVAGYTVNPEGNVTVNGGPVKVPVVFSSTSAPPKACTNLYWTGKNNTLSGNCLGSFEVDYAAFNATSGFAYENSTFTVGPLAEVTPLGAIVALATPGFQGSGTVSVTSNPQGVNVTDIVVGNVTNAIGVNRSNNESFPTPDWIPSEASGVGGAITWGQGDQVLGRIVLGIVFHFANGSGNGSSRVKFDVTVTGWPWVSPKDVLGVEVAAQSYALPGGSHFSYTPSTDTITQQWDSNGRTISSLAFGPTANASGEPPSSLRVTDQVGLYPGDDPTLAVALLTFVGAGGYANMTYDPWVLFGAQPAVVPPLSHHGSSASLNSLLTPPVWIAIGGVTVGGILLGAYARRIRNHPIEEGLASTA